MSITFSVDSVVIGKLNDSSMTCVESFKHLCGVDVEASDAEFKNLLGPTINGVPGRNSNAVKMNGFLRAIHEAYANHLPLVLSPDDVWLAIAQGFSYHVNANAEKLRKNFVAHEGKETIRIIRDEFIKGNPNNNWAGCFSEFSEQIAKFIGKDKRDMLVSDFSTSTPINVAVSEVTLMNTMKAYFDYVVQTKCGIPSITLLGTVEDWDRVILKTVGLACFECGSWIEVLLPVLCKFREAFLRPGDVDTKFWSSIYKIEGPKGSGGTKVTGWVDKFFPYLRSWEDTGQFTLRNTFEKYGISPDMYPVGITSTPFIWEYYGKIIPMQFLGGFIGVSQDPDTGAVRPVQGWGIADK